MTFINHAGREITFKIVYYGPGLSGKSANLRYIHDNTEPESRGKLVSLTTETDPLSRFEFVPIELGIASGLRARFHLYSVPGVVTGDKSRRVILDGVDGVVFVADSQADRFDANLESLDNLDDHLRLADRDARSVARVLQLNKRDLPAVLPATELVRHLQRADEQVIEAIAPQGIGVLESLDTVVRLVLPELTSPRRIARV